MRNAGKPEPPGKQVGKSVLIVGTRGHVQAQWMPLIAGPARALLQCGIPVHILLFSVREAPVDPDLADHVRGVFDRLPFWLRPLTPALTRGLYAKRVHDFDLVLESAFCAIKALTLLHRLNVGAVHFADGCIPVTILFAMFCRCPVVHHCCTPYTCRREGKRSLRDRVVCLLTDWALRRGRVFFVFENAHTSEICHNVLGDLAVHVPSGRTPVERMPSKTEARTRLGLPADGPVWLCFGGHRDTKDYRSVFEAARLCDHPPFLLFAGKVVNRDPYAIGSEAGYTAFRVDDRFIPDNEVPFYFAAADGTILSYVPGASELGGSGVLFDACAYDCPVIAVDTPYFRDFVAQHGCGVLFEYGSAAQLADAMRVCAGGDPERMARIRDGLRHARDTYAWSNVIKMYLVLYGDPFARLAGATSVLYPTNPPVRAVPMSDGQPETVAVKERGVTLTPD